METPEVAKKFAEDFIVLTVPMRNGNDTPLFSCASQNISSYRTYEEWKRFYF